MNLIRFTATGIAPVGALIRCDTSLTNTGAPPISKKKKKKLQPVFGLPKFVGLKPEFTATSLCQFVTLEFKPALRWRGP